MFSSTHTHTHTSHALTLQDEVQILHKASGRYTHTWNLLSQGSFKLWRQQHFCVIAVFIMNGFNTHSWWQRQLKKMGIMATDCGVHIVTATVMEKIEFLVLSVALAAAVWTNPHSRPQLFLVNPPSTNIPHISPFPIPTCKHLPPRTPSNILPWNSSKACSDCIDLHLQVPSF